MPRLGAEPAALAVYAADALKELEAALLPRAARPRRAVKRRLAGCQPSADFPVESLGFGDHDPVTGVEGQHPLPGTAATSAAQAEEWNMNGLRLP